MDEKHDLEALINREMELRRKWREAKAVLENLVDPITEHNNNCCKWWNENATNKEEIIVTGTRINLKINKPKLEAASVETYLPYGIDYSEIEVINIRSKTI